MKKENAPGAVQRGPSSIAAKSVGQQSNKTGTPSSAPPPSAATKYVGIPSKSTAFGKKARKFTLNQLVRVLRRFLTVAAAIVYIQISLLACVQTLDVLSISMTESFNYSSYDSVLLAEAAGSKVVSSLAYNLTFLDPVVSELVTPIVDCTFTSLVIGDSAEPKLFYLMHKVADPDDMYLLTVSVGVQEYQVSKQKTVGPTAISTITFIDDMRATEITHHFAAALGYPYKDPAFQICEDVGQTSDGRWLLKSVPKNPKSESSKTISISTPTGSYISSADEQSTLVILTWRLPQDPKAMLAHWVWYGKTVAQDPWAWVHLLHLYFAVSAIFSLIVLLVVSYYNLCLGKVWVGDAFVSISSTHAIRSTLVIVLWIMNRFWGSMEFTLFSGNRLGGNRAGILSPGIMRADLLSLYMSLVGLIGAAFKERIDPALTLILFSIGFEARLEIIKVFPGMVKTLTEFADLEYILGITPQD